MPIPEPVPLVCRPTPLHPLPRLSRMLGLDLWIKRDDLTGFAFGGNKGRKLEYLVAEALAQGADTVVSCGAAQSNFLRQLGAACAMHGLRCVAVAMHLPYEPGFGQPQRGRLLESSGNILLDRLLGVELRILPDGSWEELFSAAERVADELEEQGRRVYRIPVGGSSPLGALAFREAGLEARRQDDGFQAVVFASSSGSTHAGLAHAYAGSHTRVIGISCDPEPDLYDTLEELCAGQDRLLGTSVGLRRTDFELRFEAVGSGYGVAERPALEAILLMARHEGIFLDPVYSGKAFAGLLALAEARDLPQRVLFWHTGGTPTLMAVPDECWEDAGA